MQGNLKLIYKDKEFVIPSDVRYFNDINREVRDSFLSSQQYIVKSNVQEDTFNSFYKFWIKKEIPNFTLDNISEYDQLSQEFGLMEDVISIYRNLSLQIQDQETKNQQLNLQIKEKSNNYIQLVNTLLNSDLLRHYDLRDQVYEALQDENYASINFLLTRKTIENNGLLFILNKNDQTAELIECVKSYEIINIPHSININFLQYKVTKIHEYSFSGCSQIKTVIFSENLNLVEIPSKTFYNCSLCEIVIPKSVVKIGDEVFENCSKLKKVSFEKDSQLKSIGNQCFYCCGIEYLSLPSNFIEFGSEWCSLANSLNILNVSQSKQNCICLYNNQFLLSKSDPKSDVFDILLLAPKNIKKAVIPPFIKKIADCAFEYTLSLEEFECTPDSELKIFGENVFRNSSIKKLTIPSSVEKFGDCWCSELYNLTEITVIKQKIENTKLFEKNFILCKTDLNSDIFDVLVCANRNVQDVTIPSFIKIIGSSAFDGCQKLQQFEFASDSNCVSIEKFAFAHSSLYSINIPSQITKIKKGTFQECNYFEQIKIPENSNLQKFGSDSFLETSITSLYIPSFVDEFKDSWCDTTPRLTSIKISPKNKNFMYYDNSYIIGKSDNSSSIYDVLVFARRDICYAVIPSFIKSIASCSFNSCEMLQNVLFSSDSQLEIINEYAFAFTSLERIKIPSSVKQIKFSAFDNCENLEIFEFEENSQLELLDISAFHDTNIKSFIFPPHLKNIKRFYLDFLSPLIIEILEDSEFRSFEYSMFGCSSTIIMIPAKISNEFYFY